MILYFETNHETLGLSCFASHISNARYIHDSDCQSNLLSRPIFEFSKAQALNFPSFDPGQSFSSKYFCCFFDGSQPHIPAG